MIGRGMSTWPITLAGSPCLAFAGSSPSHSLSHLYLFSLHSPQSIMSDPTKAETEQVFKVLKAQKANKVCSMPLDDAEESLTLWVDVFRLPGSQSDVVQRNLRRVHLLRVFECSS